MTWWTDGLPTGGQKVSWPTARANSLNSPAGRPPLIVSNIKFAGQATSLLPCGSCPSLLSVSLSTQFHPSLCQLPGSTKAQPTYQCWVRGIFEHVSRRLSEP